MDILERISMLNQADVENLAGAAADPKHTVEELIRAMGEALEAAEPVLKEHEARTTQMESELARLKQESIDWGYKAEKAFRAGDDDAGQEALGTHHDLDAECVVRGRELVTHRELVKRLATEAATLRSKRNNLIGDREAVLARLVRG